MSSIPQTVSEVLRRGTVIPAVPLALDAQRKFDPRRQQALLRYYEAAGAGGVAIGVHTTQFAIRDPAHGLFEPLLRFSAEVLQSLDAQRQQPLIRVGGVCGNTAQAVREASLLRETGFHTGLLNLSALKDASEDTLIDHCRQVADVLPMFGFYLGTHVGGRELPYSFWRRFAEIDSVVAVKVACFNRYQTIDCVRAIAESGRVDIALYTGNDDNIVLDLVTPYRFESAGGAVERRIVGGLLGHWAVWTRRAVELLQRCHRVVEQAGAADAQLLRLAVEVTDCNAALFDAAGGFAGCIPGIHEVLRRQGLLEGTWMLDPSESLSPGQAEEIDRIYAAYPHLHDDHFVAEHREAWLAD
ncbi:MAG: dihydrodipicolinate synthase family protein [Pirellulales bacterium]